jgi:hypothetical protein
MTKREKFIRINSQKSFDEIERYVRYFSIRTIKHVRSNQNDSHMNQSIESITNDCIETIIALTLTRFYIDDIQSRVETYFYAIRNDTINA